MTVNTSGFQPCEYKVLLKLDPPEERTKGGIILPEEAKEKEQRESVISTLVARGGNAFEDWQRPWPELGHRVRTVKHPGPQFKGVDGQMYMTCQDKDVIGIVMEEANRELLPSDQPDGGGDGIYEHIRSK
jgi:chaperonin GroES